MPKFQNRLQELLDAYTKNEISESGLNELCNLLKDENDMELKKLFESELRNAVYQPMNPQKLDRMLGEILKGNEDLETENSEKENYGKVVSIGRQRKWWWAAAGIILLLVAAYFMRNSFNGTKGDIEPIVQIDKATDDIQAPKITRATLKLDDGTIVYLDSAQDGSLAVQGNVSVVKTADGEIQYSGSASNTISVAYNTVFNPRGSKVQALTLNDGTKVWLNAESSLTFPTSFVGNERKVSISGEAYFEVAHHESKPFKVNVAGKAEVEVLGTHFNINSYSDEPFVKTTLLEGKVKVTKADNYILLNPGQQAVILSEQQNIKIVPDVDIEEVTAWKNGRFLFNGADVETIMRQVARWYDVDIVYENKINELITGGLGRSENVQQLLNILEATGKVKFRVNGKQIVVSAN